VSLEELGLTPLQLSEVSELEEALTDAWLDAITPAVRNPAAWFLAGVRSGAPPHSDKHVDRARNAHLAERFIATAGLFMPEPELMDELFGARGRLRAWPELRARMVDAWQAQQPQAVLVDVERTERAERWRKGQAAMQALGKARITDGHSTESEHSSQTSAALTAVSAHTSTSDVDADIAW
jgi:hypothetical protein